MTPAPHRRRPRRLAGLAVALAILALVELTLRLLGLPAPEPGARFINEEAERAHAGLDYVADAELFWRLPPSRTIVGGAYRTNRLGLRGPELARPPSPGTYRVALVGDSCAFGLGLDLPDTVGALLESLTGPAGARVEVARLAVPGYSTLQSLGLARRLWPGLGVDATVLWPSAFNDAAPACGASDARLAAAGRSRVLPWLRRLALFRALGRVVRGSPPECPPRGAGAAPRVTLAEFRSNLAALEALARPRRPHGAGRVVTLVPTVVAGARAEPYARALGRRAHVVDPRLGRAALQADLIHPNRAGSVAIARALAPALGLGGALDAQRAADAAIADEAQAALGDGDAARALSLLAPLVPRAADRPRLLAAHVEALSALERWTEARAAVDRALARHPTFTELRRLRAELLAATGDETGAVRELRAALARDRGWLAGHLALARILLAQGQRDQARAQVARALRIAPASPELGRLAAELGE